MVLLIGAAFEWEAKGETCDVKTPLGDKFALAEDELRKVCSCNDVPLAQADR